MVNHETKPLLRVGKEKRIQAGPIELGHRAIWAVVCFTISVGGLITAVQHGVWLYGLLLVVGMLVLYGVLFGMSTAALGYRYVSHSLRGFLGTNQQVANQPTAGEELIRAWNRRQKPKPIQMIGRIDFLPHETPSGILGVAFDRRSGTYTALMWGAGSSLLSAAPAIQMGRLQAFAELLDSMAEASNPIYRFAWHEQTLIREPQHPAKVIETLRQTTNLTRQHPPNQAVLLARAGLMGEESIVHWTTMTLTIQGREVQREARTLGKSVTGYAKVLEKRLDSFYSLATGREYGYSSIGLKAAKFATYNDLVLDNRLALDPVFAQSLWQEWERPAEELSLLDEQVAWPGYVDFRPTDYCRLGQTYHMGFYIQEFTRAGMPPDQLWNILKLPIPKTVTVVFQMVPPRRAQRFAEWSTSSAAGSNIDRAKSNRRVTAVQSKAAEDALAHETEMATHQGQVGRVRCYIDLTGASLEEVTANATLLQHAATDARFLIEPLTGRQHLGIEAVMPIGRGLSSLTENWKWLNR